MAKNDVVVARIDADIARMRDIETYAQTHGDNQKLLEIINDDIVKLQAMRAYVTQDATDAPKPRKPRGKNKPKNTVTLLKDQVVVE
jgi:hypothetical protein